MNLLTYPLPNGIYVDGKFYDIDTDFRRWIRLNDELLMNERNNENIIKLLTDMFLNEVPENGKEAIKQLTLFLQGNTHERLDHVKKRTSVKGRSKNVFSYTYDCDYIISAFQEYYHIDLLHIEYLHWWHFNILLNTLDARCELKQRIQYRSIDVSKIKDAKERSRVRNIQSEIALPDNCLSEEEIASVFE